jgi:photosystem II stability/assembly factor-like uncharacterized protein
MQKLAFSMVVVGVAAAVAGLVNASRDRSTLHPTPLGWNDARRTALNLPVAVRQSKVAETSEREEEEREFGPPPPGYIRILGDAVPGWSPTDMHRPAPRGATWQALGPRPITNEYWSGNDNASGRVVSIAPHPSDPNTIYIASASGGIWKTTNGGTSWTPLTDELSILNHGAIAIDPSNPDAIYAGTGEYQTGSGGDGLFRSPDAGATWSRIATAAQVGANCSEVLIDPSDSSRIFVSGDLGVVRSTNGGASWTTVLAGACSDIVVHPTTPATMYAGKHNVGIFRSTDGGTNWSQLAGGLPTTDVARIILAISRSLPSTLYAAVVNGGGGLRGLYKTVDGGNTWTRLSATPNFPASQGWYDCFVGVDPTNANIVYGGGVWVYKTSNGGTNWMDVSSPPGGGDVHPDEHAVAFGADNTVWVGCDGGVWKSTSSGNSWINCNATLTVTQNYNIALHPTDPNRVIGGTQDNGSAEKQTAGVPWPQILSGDGGFAAYDFTTPTRRYTTYVYLNVYRIAGSATDDITGPWGSDPANFIAPLVMDPNNSHTLLGGTNRVWRTTNADTSATWTAISTSTVGGGGTIGAIAVAIGASNTIYAGNSAGDVFVTTNASTWNNRSTGLPTGEISDIVLDPANPAVAYVSYYNATGGRVFRSDNFGVSWTNRTGALPSGVSAKALAVDWRFNPPDLFVGTGSGVYESNDGGATWTKDGTDLPNVNIGDLLIDTTRITITAGTYGRGTWRKDLRSAPCPADLNGDGVVDLGDLATLLTHFGTASGATPADGDLDGDGDVELDDLTSFLAAFGSTCP